MSDKTQLVNIQKYLMGQPIDIINDDDGEYYLSTESALELAQQILDICQPQWIPVAERLPSHFDIVRGLIGGYEQECFYKCIKDNWYIQDEYNNWNPVNVVPEYWYSCPNPPEDTA